MAGGGYFYDLASHQLDFLDYLLGPVTDACGIASNQAGLYPAEDIVTGTFRFGSGVQGTGNWCFAAAESDADDLIVLTGSRGVLSWPTFAGYYVDLKTDANPDSVRFHFDIPEHIQQPLIGTIVRELQDFHSGRQHETLKTKADSAQSVTVTGSPDQNTGATDANTEPRRCPSTGVTAARTNRVMEALTGKQPMPPR
jgi:predicted dehydrogenase